MKTCLLYAFGFLAVIAGLIWMAQGSGYFPYPAESFMIDQKPWIYWGGALAAVGLFAIIAAHYRRGG